MPREAVITPENLKVELRPHQGTRRTRVGRVKVTLPQDVVYINGVWSGYVGHGPNAQINLLHSDLPQDIVQAVRDQIAAIRKEQVGHVALTQQLQENNVVIDSDDNLSLEDEHL